MVNMRTRMEEWRQKEGMKITTLAMPPKMIALLDSWKEGRYRSEIIRDVLDEGMDELKEFFKGYTKIKYEGGLYRQRNCRTFTANISYETLFKINEMLPELFFSRCELVRFITLHKMLNRFKEEQDIPNEPANTAYKRLYNVQ